MAREAWQARRLPWEAVRTQASAGPATLITNPAGIINSADDAASRLLNRPLRFLLGKPLVVYLPKEHAHHFLTRLLGARQAEQRWTTTFMPFDRAPLAVALTVRPVAQLGEQATALHWTIEPLPAEAAASAALAAAPPTLAEMDQAAAGATADDVDALRRTFLSAMSHELLTPLAIIQGQAETLRYPAVRGDQAQVDQALDAIKDEAVRLRRLVQNVIDTARARAAASYALPRRRPAWARYSPWPCGGSRAARAAIAS